MNNNQANVHMQGREKSKESKQLIVAIDHGLSFQDIQGLERPLEILKQIASIPHVSGIIASSGIYKQAQRLEIDLSNMNRFLTVDYVAVEEFKGSSVMSLREIIIEPEEALFMKPDVFKMFLNIYDDDVQLARNIRDFERFVMFGARHGISALAEIMFFGNQAFSNAKTQSKELLRSCRLAMELGADSLKIPLIADLDIIGEIVDRFKLPTYILGGSKYSDEQAFINDLSRLSTLPISGVMFGRNIWQHENMEEIINKIITALQ